MSGRWRVCGGLVWNRPAPPARQGQPSGTGPASAGDPSLESDIRLRRSGEPASLPKGPPVRCGPGCPGTADGLPPDPGPARGCHRNRSPHRDMTPSRLPSEACHNPLTYCPRVPLCAAAGRERCGRPHRNRSGHARASGRFPGATDSSGVPSRAAFTGDSPANRGFPPRFLW